MLSKDASIRNYFVDEAGDGVLFNRKGHIIVGNEGCSRFFILGLIDIVDPESVGREFEILRSELLADPYFKDVPSMQLDQHKTAVAFHAKDDLPEVRREVFKLLLRCQLRFFAVVRDKLKVVEYVRQRNQNDLTYRYHPNELYDYLVRRLFKDRLHKDDAYNVYFAKRGRRNRTEALRVALETARHYHEQQWGSNSDAPIFVIPTTPSECPGQQVADYFLWALQRFYERQEERYIASVWSHVSLVHDLDDTRLARYGVYYSQRKPLTRAAALVNRLGI